MGTTLIKMPRSITLYLLISYLCISPCLLSHTGSPEVTVTKELYEECSELAKKFIFSQMGIAFSDKGLTKRGLVDNTLVFYEGLMKKIHEGELLEVIKEHKRIAAMHLDLNPKKNNEKLSDEDAQMYIGWFKNGIDKTLQAIEKAIPVTKKTKIL